MTVLNLLRLLRPRLLLLSDSRARHAHGPARLAARFSARRSKGSGELQRPRDLTARRPVCGTGSGQAGSSSEGSRGLSTSASSDDGNLVYSGNLGSAVRGVKMFSYSTSAISLMLMPQILFKTALGASSVAVQVATCGFVAFFTVITPVLLHAVTKGYVVQLYHNPDTDVYTAVTISLCLTRKKRVFHQSQVRVPGVSKLFTTFYAGRVGLMVNPDLFPVPNDYNHLMGYDKPFSFDQDKPDADSS